MQPKELGRITDIMDAVSSITEFTKDITFEEFNADKMRSLAVVRLFEIIGEASKGISEEVRALYPEVSWKHMAGLRDVLIHAYHTVDNQVLWNIIDKEFKNLAINLKRILDEN